MCIAISELPILSETHFHSLFIPPLSVHMLPSTVDDPYIQTHHLLSEGEKKLIRFF